jgi:hypothetical protein
MFPSRRIITSGGGGFTDDYSLAFDGDNDYIDCGDSTAYDGLDVLTIATWVNFADTGKHHIFGKGIYNHSAASFALYYDPGASSGSLRFSIANGRSDLLNSLGLGTSGAEWNHLAVTYSNTDDETFFYVNGVKNSPSSGSGTYASIANTSKTVRIGVEDGDTDYLKGNISEIATYSAALTEYQIKSIYNSREPYNHKEGIAASSLNGWWRMGDGTENHSGTTIYDMSSNSNDGTMTNMDANDYEGGTP